MSGNVDKQQGPGRPRCIECQQAVQKAALEILAERGYKGVTLQRIAQRAGVGRQTLYRWWNSKAEIVLEAFAEKAGEDIPTPDTGSVRQDLTSLIKASGRTLETGSAATVLGLLAEALLDPDFAHKFWEHFQERRREVLKSILAKGIERGELPPDLDKDFWADIVFGSLLYRLYTRNAPIDETFGRDLAVLLPVRR